MKAENYVYCGKITSRTNICGWKNEAAIGSKSWNIWSPHAARPSTEAPKAHGVVQQCVCSMWDLNNPLLACPQALFLASSNRKHFKLADFVYASHFLCHADRVSASQLWLLYFFQAPLRIFNEPTSHLTVT